MPTFYTMGTPRPKRLTKKPTRYSQSPPLITLDSQLSDIPEVVRPKKRPLQAIPAEPLPIEIQSTLPPTKAHEIPPYDPPLGRIKFIAGGASSEPLDELSTFLLLLNEECLQQIMAATNSYAKNAPHSEPYESPRPWTSITRAELLRFLGVFFYIRLHKETLRSDYWRPSSRVAGTISERRFDQIYRFLHLRDKYTQPQQPHEGFHWKIEPVGTIIRKNYQQNWSLASYVAIDKVMLPFLGRSNDTVKMANKPISKGFKIWVLADLGYIYIWLWFSGYKKRGTEVINLKD
jgi:Transposase IS4